MLIFQRRCVNRNSLISCNVVWNYTFLLSKPYLSVLIWFECLNLKVRTFLPKGIRPINQIRSRRVFQSLHWWWNPLESSVPVAQIMIEIRSNRGSQSLHWWWNPLEWSVPVAPLMVKSARIDRSFALNECKIHSISSVQITQNERDFTLSARPKSEISTRNEWMISLFPGVKFARIFSLDQKSGVRSEQSDA